MKTIILNYLKTDRSFNSGLRLYMQHGISLSFKTVLNRQGYSEYNHKVLLEELRKISGITPDEFKAIMASKVEAAHAPEPVVPTIDESLPVTDDEKAVFINEIPEQVRKSIRLRDEFPFLAESSCPAEFKIMVHDMLTAYSNYVEAHKRLFDATTPEELQKATSDVVENYLDNREAWDELNYYKSNGKVLGKHPVFAATDRIKEIRAMVVADHVKLKKSLENNIARTKKTIKDNPEHENNAERRKKVGIWEMELTEVNSLLGISS